MGSGSSDPDPTAEMRRYRFADPLGSEPLDLDPVAQIRRYPFGLVFLLKSPWTLLESTCSPAPFKNICRSAQSLVFRPLDSLEIEPAVRIW
jgi:hypothetical protein